MKISENVGGLDDVGESGQRMTDGVWAVGDIAGAFPLTHVGKYQGVVAASILGRPCEASFDAVPRITSTDQQAATVGPPRPPSAVPPG